MTKPGKAWAFTGDQQQVFPSNFDRVPDYDPRAGDHFWNIITMYRVNPETETPILDAENLVQVAGPLCFYCEEPYTSRLSKRRCPGKSRHP